MVQDRPHCVRAAQLPVTFEPSPNASLVADGIEADSLGLFTGPAFGDEEQSASPLPPQIILYLENLWDMTEGDEEVFLEKVHKRRWFCRALMRR